MSSFIKTMCAEETDVWLHAAHALLLAQGRTVEPLFHQQKQHVRTRRIQNLFRGKEHGLTVRFLGIVDAEGKLTALQPITRQQKEALSNDGHVHTLLQPAYHLERRPANLRTPPKPLSAPLRTKCRDSGATNSITGRPVISVRS